MKKILFVTYGGGHVNIVIQVAKYLRKHFGITPIIVALTNSVIKLEKEGIPYYRLLDLLDGEYYEKSYRYGELLAEDFHNSNSGLDKIDTISYLGPSFLDLVEKYGEDEANKLFEKKGRKSFLPTKIYEQILEKVHPDVVVTTCGERSERATMLAAKKLSIPSVRIVDLFGHGSFHEADYFCVMNQYAKDSLIDKGVNESQIFITGQPAFESLFQITNEDVDEVKEQLAFNEKPLVLWASQKLSYTKDVALEIFETFSKLRDVNLVIKLHPSEEGELHYNLAKEYNLPNVKIVRELDIQSLIKASDLVITQYSTSGLEAILLDKPLITINYSGEDDIMPYASSGMAKGIYTRNELEDNILSVLSNKGEKKDNEIFKMNQTPSKQVSKLILEASN